MGLCEALHQIRYLPAQTPDAATQDLATGGGSRKATLASNGLLENDSFKLPSFGELRGPNLVTGLMLALAVTNRSSKP